MNASEPSFLVQALDNEGENLVHVAEWVRRGDPDRPPVQRLRELVNEVGLNGREVPLHNGMVRLRKHEGAFNLEIDLEAHDAAGRIVTVLCHARSPRAGDRDWHIEMSRALRSFLKAHELPRPDDTDGIFIEVAGVASQSRGRRALMGLLDELTNDRRLP